MPFRLRRSIRIAPGIRINLGKRGASLSVGRPGFTVNYAKRRTNYTVGLPGTGLSYTKTIRRPPTPVPPPAPPTATRPIAAAPPTPPAVGSQRAKGLPWFAVTVVAAVAAGLIFLN